MLPSIVLVTKVTNALMVTMVTGAYWLLRLRKCAGSVSLLIFLLFLVPSFASVFLFYVFCIHITLFEVALLADVSLCDKNIEFAFVIAYTCSFTVVIRQSWWRMKIQTAHS
jgi:hypothetical protein